MAWILIIVGGVFLSRMAVMQFVAHMDEASVATNWQGIPGKGGVVALAQESTSAKIQLSDSAETQSAKQSSAPGKSKKAWNGWREMIVDKIVAESPDCQSFYLRPADGLDLPEFYGGQYALVGVEDPATQKRVSRCYSLSDAHDTGYYRITVKRVPGGRMSNLLHDAVQAGATIKLQAPGGRFYSDQQERTRPLNLIAAGIGITPMVSMLNHCLRATPERPVRLFYQLRNGSNTPFLDQLRGLAADATNPNVQLFVAYSRPIEGDVRANDARGRISAKSVLAACGSVEGEFMICGPEAFMSSIAEGLVAAGVPVPDVRYESFGGSSKGVGAITVQSDTDESDPGTPGGTSDPAGGQPAVGHEITFAKSGQTTTWESADDVLLDTAERVEIDVESSCRSGQCGSCVLRLLKGDVAYDEDPEFDAADDEVLMCVGRPCGPITVDA